MQNQEFEFKPSKIYLVLMTIILLVSLGVALFLPISLSLKSFLSLIIILYGAYVFWRYGLLRSRQSIIGIKHLSDDKWLLQTTKNHYQADLCDFSTVTSLVSVLRFHTAKRIWPTTCVIFCDSLDLNRYRQLLVTLRMS